MSTLKIIGHRGAAGLAAENTLEAIQAGLDARADEIEIDVRVTSDGVVVLSHDPWVADGSGARVPINSQTFTELHRLQPTLTLFRDAATLMKGRAPLLVEIKPGEPLEPIIAIFQGYLQAAYSPSDFAVASFDFSILRRIKREIPQLPLVVNESWSGVRASHRARVLGTKRIHMNARWLWRGFIRAVHNGGYRLGAYTVNDPTHIAAWEPYLSSVVTDHPEKFTK